jgi:predicted enzyme related to lactoylglutathione lyase
MTGVPTWFELGVEDARRAQAFYGGLFGWRFDDVGEDGSAAIDTGGVGGGLHGHDPGAAPIVFFGVEDLDAATARVRALGGVVEGDPSSGEAEQQRRFGRFALCRDDQGSPFGLHQPPPGS